MLFLRSLLAATSLPGSARPVMDRANGSLDRSSRARDDTSAPPTAPAPPRERRSGPRLLELLIPIALLGCGAWLSWQASRRLGEMLLAPGTANLWFESDVARVFANMVSRHSDHYRTSVHPLWPAFGVPFVGVARRLLGIEPITAVRLLLALVTGAVAVAVHGVLRLAGVRLLDAALAALLTLATSAVVFYAGVPETHLLGGLSILCALGVTTWYRSRSSRPSPTRDVAIVLASAFTLGVTVTNWMAGVAAAFALRPFRRACVLTIYAFQIITLLWAVQRLVVPSAAYFIGERGERKYAVVLTPRRAAEVVRTLAVHGVAMPRIADAPPRADEPAERYPLLTVQRASLRPEGVPRAVGVAAWALLLLLGVATLARSSYPAPLRLALVGTTLGQCALFAIYGAESFLYTPLTTPLLVVLASAVFTTVLAPLGRVLAVVATLSLGVANWERFGEVTDRVANRLDGRHALRVAMARHPEGPWPRGTSHVVLASAGSPDRSKSYVEPGGLLSPAMATFGLSVWQGGPRDRPALATETLPLDAVHDTLSVDSAGVPEYRSRTPGYALRWRHAEVGTVVGSLVADRDGALVLRSSGPAGGKVSTLRRGAPGVVLVNDRWQVEVTGEARSRAAVWELGVEAGGARVPAASSINEVRDATGWGYARLPLPSGERLRVAIRDLQRASANPTPALLPNELGARPRVTSNDARFAGSLDAQVAHLTMGLTPDGARPGDPMNYSFTWLRDAAYVAVALSRAGQAAAAEHVLRPMLDQDFFGGFGAEADAPGLALWAIGEVAVRDSSAALARTAWPAVQRKVALVERMLAARADVRALPSGPILPALTKTSEPFLVARPAVGGLIEGKMDHHYPRLFVNAVSHLGLVEAARVADRVGDPASAQRWRSLAATLRERWTAAFAERPDSNDRTYASAMWPTGVAEPVLPLLRDRLGARWTAHRDASGAFAGPQPWTYFAVGEAHQWLVVGEPDRAWRTLEWFWSRQVLPGTYAWWEGTGEENATGAWDEARGWVRPPFVTPHYWTAAEMLLLQLDMLATERLGHGDAASLVIGAGVPRAWLADPLEVRGIRLRAGSVDWTWDGHIVRVRGTGQRPAVRLGPAFPAGTPVDIQWSASR